MLLSSNKAPRTMPPITIPYIKEKWAHSGFQKYFRNMGWLIAARVISFITSFLTIAIVARYLGPENLGRLDYFCFCVFGN